MPKKIPVIFGVSGTSLTTQERAFFCDKNLYGFILFSRNIESETQLHELVGELRTATIDEQVKIFIDQEGGRVLRLVPPFTEYRYPSAGYFGQVYDDFDPVTAIKMVKQNYSNLMNDLKKYSIDGTCAPVADLRFPDASLVIGDRSFGYVGEENKVIELCRAAIEGIERVGGDSVIKHIPGHGRAKVDSHTALPVVTASLAELMATDFEVFKQLSIYSTEQSYAMTAHIVYKELDPHNPATLSYKVIDFIRTQIGFKGLIMTDDICMEALHQNINPDNPVEKLVHFAEVARDCILAGCDIVLHCNGDIDQMKMVCGALDIPVDSV